MLNVLNATENISMKCREDLSSSETLALSLFGLRYICLIMDLFCLFEIEFLKRKKK